MGGVFGKFTKSAKSAPHRDRDYTSNLRRSLKMADLANLAPMALNPENWTFHQSGSESGGKRKDARPSCAGTLGAPTDHFVAKIGAVHRRTDLDRVDAQSDATFARPAVEDDDGDTGSISENDCEQMTQPPDPTVPVIQDCLVFERLYKGSETSMPHSFSVSFPLWKPLTIGRGMRDADLGLPDDPARDKSAQFASKLHGFFYSEASGVYYTDTSTWGSFYSEDRSDDRVKVPSVLKGSSHTGACGVGPLKKGDVIHFGSNGDVCLASGQPAPYDGCSYKVVEVVGYIGSGTRTNQKRKRESDSSDAGGGDDEGGDGNSGGSSGDSRSDGKDRWSIDKMLKGKSAEERARILRGALKKANKQARTEARLGGLEAPDRLGGHHASAASAARAQAASTGSSMRRSNAEQARFEKAQRSHNRTTGGRPGNQKKQIAHKKNLIVGRKKLAGRFGLPNSGTRNVLFADQGKGSKCSNGEGNRKDDEGMGKVTSSEGKGKGNSGKGKGRGKGGCDSGGRGPGGWGSGGWGSGGWGSGGWGSGSWGSGGRGSSGGDSSGGGFGDWGSGGWGSGGRGSSRDSSRGSSGRGSGRGSGGKGKGKGNGNGRS